MESLFRCLCFFACCFCVCGMASASSIEKRDIVYASIGDRQLNLDLYLPEKQHKPYLVIWVHGGAWHSGSKENPPIHLLEGRYALASVEYRKTVEAPFPALIHDIKAAIRFLRAKAKEYGYRSDKIAIWGPSAGGHLAALVGVSNGVELLEGELGEYANISSDIQLIINGFGPTNFATILAQSTPHGLSVRAPAMALLFGLPVNKAETQIQQASVTTYVDKSDPPLLIMHGDQDNQVPINQSHELHGLYKLVKRPAQLYIAHGIGHSNEVFEGDGQKTLLAFLGRYLN